VILIIKISINQYKRLTRATHTSACYNPPPNRYRVRRIMMDKIYQPSCHLTCHVAAYLLEAHLTWLVAVRQQWKLFLLPFFFSLMCIGFHAKPLKIQICPRACICFKVGTDFYLFILRFLEFFLFQFHPSAFYFIEFFFI
jgi:hypothetical protein